MRMEERVCGRGKDSEREVGEEEKQAPPHVSLRRGGEWSRNDRDWASEPGKESRESNTDFVAAQERRQKQNPRLFDSLSSPMNRPTPKERDEAKERSARLPCHLHDATRI